VFFSKPVPTALFLCANGLILLWSERRRKARAVEAQSAAVPARPGYGQHPQYQQAPHQQDQWHSQPQQQQWNRDWDPRDHDPQGPRHPRDQWDQQRDDPYQQPRYQPRQYEQGQWPAQPPLRRDADAGARPAEHADHAVAADRRLSTMGLKRAVL